MTTDIVSRDLFISLQIGIEIEKRIMVGFGYFSVILSESGIKKVN